MSSDEDFENYDANPHPSTTSDKFESSVQSRKGQNGKTTHSPLTKKKTVLNNRKEPTKSKGSVHPVSDDIFVEVSESEKPKPSPISQTKPTNYFLNTKRKPDPVSSSTVKFDTGGGDEDDYQPRRARKLTQDSQAIDLTPGSVRNPVSAQEYKSLRAQVIGQRPEDRIKDEMRHHHTQLNIPKIGKGVFKLSTVYLPSSERLYNNCRRSLEIVDGTQIIKKTIDAIMEPQNTVHSILNQVHWNSRSGKDYIRLDDETQLSRPQPRAPTLSVESKHFWEDLIDSSEVNCLDQRNYLDCNPLNSEGYYDKLFKDFISKNDQSCEDLDKPNQQRTGDISTVNHLLGPQHTDNKQSEPYPTATKYDEQLQQSGEKSSVWYSNQKPSATTPTTTTTRDACDWMGDNDTVNKHLSQHTYGLEGLIAAASGDSVEQQCRDEQILKDFDNHLYKLGKESILSYVHTDLEGMLGSTGNTLFMYSVKNHMKSGHSEWKVIDPK